MSWWFTHFALKRIIWFFWRSRIPGPYFKRVMERMPWRNYRIHPWLGNLRSWDAWYGWELKSTAHCKSASIPTKIIFLWPFTRKSTFISRRKTKPLSGYYSQRFAFGWFIQCNYQPCYLGKQFFSRAALQGTLNHQSVLKSLITNLTLRKKSKFLRLIFSRIID